MGYSPLTATKELTDIVERARIAQQFWSQRPVRERIQYMVRVRDYLVEHSEEIATIIFRDNGKTRADALTADVLPAAMAIDYYARKVKKFLKVRGVKPSSILLLNKRSKIIRVPYGVIGIISPWNYPFSIPFSEVVMGLLAGNAVLLKTATETQWVGRNLEKCFLAASLPEGIFSYINLPGRIAGTGKRSSHGRRPLFL